MEELIALLVGTGAVVFSPLLLPGMRPVAKAVVKSGLAVGGVAKLAAEATTRQLHQLKPGRVENSAQQVAESPVRPQETATSPAPGAGDVAAGHPAVDWRPMVKAAVTSSQTLAATAAAMVTGVRRQWSDIVTEASTELEAGSTLAAVVQPAGAAVPTQAAEADQVQSDVAEPVSAPVPAPSTNTDWAQNAAAAVVAEAPAEPAMSAEAVAAAVGDDLQRLDGVGPKVAGILQQAGITTYAQIAAMSADDLHDLLVEAGSRYRLVDPSTWPAQAREFMEQVGVQ